MSKRVKISNYLKNENKDKFLINNVFVEKNHVPDFYFSDNMDFDLPAKNRSIHLVTNRSFNAIEIIEKIVKKEEIIKSAIAVYSINKRATEKIISLAKEGKIKEAIFLFSTIRNDRGENLEACYKKLEDSKLFKIGYYYTHAKIMAIETHQNNYVIEMSCNLANNARIENITIFNDKDLFEFHSMCITNLVKLYNNV